LPSRESSIKTRDARSPEEEGGWARAQRHENGDSYFLSVCLSVCLSAVALTKSSGGRASGKPRVRARPNNAPPRAWNANAEDVTPPSRPINNPATGAVSGEPFRDDEEKKDEAGQRDERARAWVVSRGNSRRVPRRFFGKTARAKGAKGAKGASVLPSVRVSRYVISQHGYFPATAAGTGKRINGGRGRVRERERERVRERERERERERNEKREEKNVAVMARLIFYKAHRAE